MKLSCDRMTKSGMVEVSCITNARQASLTASISAFISPKSVFQVMKKAVGSGTAGEREGCCDLNFAAS